MAGRLGVGLQGRGPKISTLEIGMKLVVMSSKQNLVELLEVAPGP